MEVEVDGLGWFSAIELKEMKQSLQQRILRTLQVFPVGLRQDGFKF